MMGGCGRWRRGEERSKTEWKTRKQRRREERKGRGEE